MFKAHAAHRHPRRGFTLLESLMASGILLAIVVAVCGALTSGQQHAYEAHQRIAASLAAEDLMGRMARVSYAQLMTWHGHDEPVGTLTDPTGTLLPSSFRMIGRRVEVAEVLKTVASLNVKIKGREVCVKAYNDGGRVLAEVRQFVPEPQS